MGDTQCGVLQFLADGGFGVAVGQIQTDAVADFPAQAGVPGSVGEGGNRERRVGREAAAFQECQTDCTGQGRGVFCVVVIVVTEIRGEAFGVTLAQTDAVAILLRQGI